MLWEKDVIINSMLLKSSKQIGELLGIDETIIAVFIRNQSSAAGTIAMDQKIAERKVLREKLRPPAKSNKQKPKKEKKVTSAQITYPGRRFIEKKYKDRNQNMAELIPVKIDHKTWIYVKPGVDVQKAKANFLSSINSSLDFHKNRNSKKI